MTQYCEHSNMQQTARKDYCPDCKYEMYYGNVHSPDPERRLNKLINPGKSATPALARECGHCGYTRLDCACPSGFEEVWE